TNTPPYYIHERLVCSDMCIIESSDSDDLLDNHSFEFYVNLRSAIVESKKIAIFAGGGIVSGSIPSKEWEETRIKGSTIASILSDKP
ncbi:MAG: chorismate-binding protein, partial [Muribaculaceae bacterium]|nr:chorismate-binding protein [Muribaculaceae bacterium]